ncbi:MAG TPA: pyridoxine 5'-phosphate synthase [Candidatus Binataceae bacterium]|nr:pyridoxine 5'-phosphate synthase [Candidatus Binataceae bacterium]
MIKLGINVDHVATLRQARLAAYPDPAEASLAAQRAGADAITVHLREDRRHIQDRDLFRIHEAIKVHLNQEMAPIPEMLEIAMELRPDEACLVPERREELTTEGGLDADGLKERLAPVIERLNLAKIAVSLFIDPEPHQIQAAAKLGATFVEIHTGRYANLADADFAGVSDNGNSRSPRKGAPGKGSRAERTSGGLSAETRAELDKIRSAVKQARSLGLKPNAGHGLNYTNVAPIAAIPGIAWLHIGHAIVARSLMVGMERAVREMVALIAPRKVSRKR